jgi:hypothetical protein
MMNGVKRSAPTIWLVLLILAACQSEQLGILRGASEVVTRELAIALFTAESR